MDVSLLWQYLGLVCCLWIKEIACQHHCSFPGKWQGLWYQSGLGEIRIEMRSVTKKGSCIEHFNDYYIIENSASNCMMCLLMLERHHNIIQYKESFCVPNSRVQSICSLIQPEGVMYTLVREPTEMIQCPFHGHFRVEYTDYAHEFCPPSEDGEQGARSFVETCQDTKSLNFHFRHCAETAALHNTDLQLECVATWKEGSEDLLYGKFSGSSIARKDDSYKCFKYNVRGSDAYLSMSADATCRGLVSSEIGPVMIKLLQDNAVSPILSCVYPDWLAAKDWVDKSSTYRLSVHQHKRHLVLHNDVRGSTPSRLTCLDFVLPGIEEFYFSGYFYVDSCTKRYNCVGLKRLHKSVFGFSIGHVTDNALTAEECARQLSGQPMEYLFMDSKLDLDTGRCPLPGHYALMPGSHSCPVNVTVGCHSKQWMEVSPSCDDYPAARFRCEHHWTEGNAINVLLKDSTDNILCYNIKERDKGLRVRSCSTTFRSHYSSENVFVSLRSQCTHRDTVTTISPDSNHHHSRHHRPPNREPPEQTDPVRTLPHTYPSVNTDQSHLSKDNDVQYGGDVRENVVVSTETTLIDSDHQYFSPSASSTIHPVIFSHLVVFQAVIICCIVHCV